MSNDNNKREDSIEPEIERVPWRRRFWRFMRRLWKVLTRIARLPIDFLILFLHSIFVNIWKSRRYRRLFKRGCQCFIAGDERTFCSLSFWYASPGLVKLICGQIDPRESAPTGHSRCRAGRRSTPMHLLRSLATFIVLTGILVGSTWTGWRLWPRLKRRLRPAATMASQREKIPAFMAEGEKLFTEGRYEEARDAFRRVIFLDRQHVAAYSWLGRSFESLGNPGGAFVSYTKACEIDPARTYAQVRLAWLHLSNNQLDKAEERAKLALKHKGDEGMAHAVLVACEVARKNMDLARTHLDLAKHSDPDNPLSQYTSGVLDMIDGREGEAIKRFEGLLDEKDIGSQAGFTLADLYTSRRKFQQAEEVLKKVAEKTASSNPRLRLAALYFLSAQRSKGLEECRSLVKWVQGNKGERHYVERTAILLLRFSQDDEALSLAMEYLKRHRESVVLHQVAAAVLFRHNLPDLAQKHCSEILLLDKKNVATRILLGRIHLRRRDAARAVEEFSDVVSLLPKNAEANFLLSGALRLAGKHSEALKAYTRTLSLAPKMHRARYERALTFADMKNWKKAEDGLKEVLKLQPAFPDAMLYLGVVYYKSGQNKPAREQYERIIKDFPRHQAVAAAANNLAWMIAEEGGDFKYAISLAATAVSLNRRQPSFLNTLGWVTYKSGDPKGAKAPLARAVALRPKQPAFRYYYGTVLMTLGEKKAAIEQLSKVLELDPDYPQAADVRKQLKELRAAEKPK